jgi:hypothetical protein
MKYALAAVVVILIFGAWVAVQMMTGLTVQGGGIGGIVVGAVFCIGMIAAWKAITRKKSPKTIYAGVLILSVHALQPQALGHSPICAVIQTDFGLNRIRLTIGIPPFIMPDHLTPLMRFAMISPSRVISPVIASPKNHNCSISKPANRNRAKSSLMSRLIQIATTKFDEVR